MGGMQLRTVALVGALGLASGWALGGRMQPSQAGDGAQGRSTGPRPLGTAPAKDVAPLTEQLRLRLEQKPRAPRPDRNPFTFGGRRTTSAMTRNVAPSPAAVEAPPESPPEPPRPGAEFRLAGMASTQGADGPIWTAMIHDGRSLLYVQRGDSLPGGFAVIDIQETFVTLRDTAGGERTLSLR